MNYLLNVMFCHIYEIRNNINYNYIIHTYSSTVFSDTVTGLVVSACAACRYRDFLYLHSLTTYGSHFFRHCNILLHYLHCCWTQASRPLQAAAGESQHFLQFFSEDLGLRQQLHCFTILSCLQGVKRVYSLCTHRALIWAET